MREDIDKVVEANAVEAMIPRMPVTEVKSIGIDTILYVNIVMIGGGRYFFKQDAW